MNLIRTIAGGAVAVSLPLGIAGRAAYDPPPEPAPSIAEIDAAAGWLCDAVAASIDAGATAFETVYTGVAYFTGTFPDAPAVTVAHLHGVLVGCAAGVGE